MNERILSLIALSVLHLLAQTSEATLQKYFEQGERALAEGRYADAESSYQKLRQLAPNVAEVYGRLGLVYYQEKRFAEAVPALRQALKLKPSLPNTDILLGMSLSETGQYSEALPLLEKGFHHTTDAALKRMSALQLERTYTGLHRDSDAVQVALELSKLYPNDPEVLYHGSRLFGNFAYLSLQKLAEVAPDSVWRHQAAGEAYESQGNFDLAIIEYRRALAQSPNRPRIHFRLGRVLLARAVQANSPADAIGQAAKEFEQELALDPTNANAAYELAEIERKSGQFDRARELFEAALKYYPDFQEANVGLGRSLLASGKPDLALQYLQQAIALNPRDEVSYYQLSQTYKALGYPVEQKKALAEFQRLRIQNAHQPGTLNAIGQEVTKQEITKQELESASPP